MGRETVENAPLEAGEAPWPGRELHVPCAAGSAQPGLSVGADGVLRLSWVEPRGEEHALRFARLAADGWSAPREVARGPDWFVNWADVPSLAADADGRLLAHWLQRAGEETYAYHVMVRLSPDGGATWNEPVRLHEDDSPTEHGFASLLPRASGFQALWLDGRAYADASLPDSTSAAMRVLAREVRADGSLGPEHVVDERACDCCCTALAACGDVVVAAYRDRSPSEVRDIALARFAADAWAAPRALHDDGWEIDGCPVNGPSLAAHGARMGAAWYTAAGGGAGAVRAALGAPEELGATRPIAIDSGRPLGRAAAAFTSRGELAVAWLEDAGGEAEWRLRLVGADRARSKALTLASVPAERRAGFARLAPWQDGLVFVWVDPEPPMRVRSVLLPREELPDLATPSKD